MSVSALSLRNLASPTLAGVGAARPLYYKNLSSAGIAALTAAQIGSMKSVEMAALSVSQIKAFDPQALASGLPTYLNNKKVLPTNFIASLGNNQISQFGASLVSATLPKMSISQIGAISTSAVSGISAAALQSLSGSQLGGFTQSQVDELSTAQIGSLRSYQISAVPAAWLNKLSSAQIQSLGSASIGALTKAQIAGLDTAHVQYLSGPSNINLVLPKLSANQISVIDATTVADISLNALKKLSNDQLKGFTVDQFSHFTKEDINWVFSSKLNIGFSAQQKDAINARKVETRKEWTQLLGTSSWDEARAMTTGKDGSFYVSGFTGGSPDGQLTSADAIITKFNPNGTQQWTQLLGSSSTDISHAMTTGKDGSVYISGWTSGNLDGQTNSGANDAFITKYSSCGVKQWTKLLGTSGNDLAQAVTTGTDGSIYVSGYASGSLDGQTNSGGADAFITKFNPNGNKQWTKLLGTSSFEGVNAMTTGADGAIYVAGATQGNLDGQINSGINDAFITKFNANGTKQWTKLLGSSENDYANALTVGKDGAVYVSGHTNGTFDGQTSSGGSDAFITKFNPNGEKRWTKLLGTSSNDYVNALTTGADGSIYMGGHTAGSLGGQTNNGAFDVFITKFNPNGTKGWTKLLGTSADDSCNALTTGKTGAIYVSGWTDGNMDAQVNAGSADAFITKYSV